MKPTARGPEPGAVGVLAGVQLVLGALAALAPGRVARAAAGPTRPAPTRVVRLLGTRMGVQGLVLVLFPDPRTRRIGATVDALHAASMLAAALWLPAYRRSSAISAALAGSTAAASVRLAKW